MRLLLLASFVAASCHAGEPAGPPFETFDSAGVVITESSRPLWAESEAWSLSPEPEFAIGAGHGDERYVFTDVRGVRRLPDGRIAVLDAGSNRVRLYGPSGVHLLDFGGEGDGPAEFRSSQYLGLDGDEFVVFEAIGGNRTWWSSEGRLLRASGAFTSEDRASGTLIMVGTMADGTAVGVRDGPSGLPAYDVGLNRRPWSVWTFDLTAQVSDSLLEVPGAEGMILETGPGGTHHQRYVFGKYSVLAVSDDRVHVGSNDEYAVRSHDRDGVLRAVVRRMMDPRPTDRADLRAWVDEWIERAHVPADERGEMRDRMLQLSFAPEMPAFRSMAADSEGNLWVEDWVGVGVRQGSFSVFRTDGAWLGSVTIPEGLSEDRISYYDQTIEIGPDYLLGVWTDEYGVDQVRLYRLEKPTG